MFREGNIEDASEDIKKKWNMMMLDLLPSISRNYATANHRASARVSTLSTASDEALLLWFLSIHSRKWATNKNNEDDGEDDDEESPPKKKNRKRRENIHREYIKTNFMTFLTEYWKQERIM